MSTLSREEILWWRTPELRLRREQFREYLERGEDWCKEGEYAFRNHSSYTSFRYEGHGLGPIGELPVLLYKRGGWSDYGVHHVDVSNLFSFDEGWRFSYQYVIQGKHYDSATGKSVGAFTGPADPSMTFLDRFLWVRNDPRTTDLATVPDNDDTRRFCRFVQSVFERFVLSEEPSVPSLWVEDGQLLCGWNDLFPEDERTIPIPEFPGQRVWNWNGISITKPEEWRWRVPRRD